MDSPTDPGQESPPTQEEEKPIPIGQVIFDRNGFQYHGRVKELADAAREVGLKF